MKHIIHQLLSDSAWFYPAFLRSEWSFSLSAWSWVKKHPVSIKNCSWTEAIFFYESNAVGCSNTILLFRFVLSLSLPRHVKIQHLFLYLHKCNLLNDKGVCQNQVSDVFIPTVIISSSMLHQQHCYYYLFNTLRESCVK